MKKLLFSVLLCLIPLAAPAQYFGKNHVQYKKLQTYYLQSRHFDIYFTRGGRHLAEFVAETAEAFYTKLRQDFRYELTDRITIVVYNSHNDFQQTNILLGPAEESVGGFTEFYKNRVVIPYEGDWEKFRHVIEHELTHAVMLQLVYGAGFQSIIAGVMQFQMPIWFVEGLAEYASRGWDTESDMFMRDAVLYDYLPHLNRLGGFLAYKGGQSVLYYIVQSFGRSKIADILHNISSSRHFESGLQQAIGMDSNTLNACWQDFLHEHYIVDRVGRDAPGDIARQITFHKKNKNFINNSPAISPDGSKIALLSDRADYFDIYVVDSKTGGQARKVVSGQRSAKFEQLHWLRPGISWSPDGKQIVFAAKAGKEDVLHILDVERRRVVRTLAFGLDGIFSPSWSPRGDRIAFTGMLRGQSDLYLVYLDGERLEQVTDDIFSDLEPSFSPDGQRLAFVSDRGEHTDAGSLPPDFKLATFDYRNYEIYLADLNATAPERLQRITNSPFWESTPVFAPDGQTLAYTSDRSGISNIYLYDFATGASRPLTNLNSGAFQLWWAADNSALAFVSFADAGYDVFVLDAPSSHPLAEALSQTRFLSRMNDRREQQQPALGYTSAAREDRLQSRYSERLAKLAERFSTAGSQKSHTTFLDTTQYKTKDGDFKVKPYRPKFSMDFLHGEVGYSQLWGVQGAGVMAFSDLLGHHRFQLYTDLYYNFESSNFYFRYLYLPRRVNFAFGVFHSALFARSQNAGIMRDRYFGANLYMAYPFDRFRRLEANLAWLGINRDFYDLPEAEADKIRVLFTSLAYVKDTAAWDYSGPMNGVRQEIRVNASPPYDSRYGLEFLTLRGDYRRYFRLRRGVALAARAAGGVSMGENPQRFLLGGMQNWVNWRYSNTEWLEDPELIYFSSFEMPLRGADFSELTGSRFFITNLELRFPIVRSIGISEPFAFGLSHIRGVVFADIGAAWERRDGREDFVPYVIRDNGLPRLHDLFMGYGIGARAILGFVLLRFDAAWSTDLERSSARPKFYFSLGSDF